MAKARKTGTKARKANAAKAEKARKAETRKAAADKALGKKAPGKSRKITVKLTKAQQAQRAQHIGMDAVKIENVLYKAKGKAVAAWLRGPEVRPMLRQDWYWIYSDDRAPERVEAFLYSRGFRRHSTKPAYIHDGGKGVRGYGDETRYEATSAFGAAA